MAGSFDLEGLDADQRRKLAQAISLIDEFRHEHAYPLTMARANLAYYVRDIPDAGVTQRLKKLPTILDKLTRYPTMSLATMEDIGGVRVVVPSQIYADDLSRRFARTG